MNKSCVLCQRKAPYNTASAGCPNANCPQLLQAFEQDDVDRLAPSQDTTEDFEIGGRPLTNRDRPLVADYSMLEQRVVAAALGAYALNLAYGATLQPFEVEHLVRLAKAVGCEITDKHLSFSATRKVLEELLKERRSQIEIHGYTLEYDDANPEHAHQQVLDRANQFPSSHTRKDLVELAAIAVAEIERLDRAIPQTLTEQPCSTDSNQQSSWTRPKAQLQHTR